MTLQPIMTQWPKKTVEWEFRFNVTPESRPVLEMYFNFCTECHNWRSECSCHERGYN